MIETERLRIGPLSPAEQEELIAIWLDLNNARIHAGDTEEQCGFVRSGGTDSHPVYEVRR